MSSSPQLAAAEPPFLPGTAVAPAAADGTGAAHSLARLAPDGRGDTLRRAATHCDTTEVSARQKIRQKG
ncbi:hypothetical protein SRB17_31330 [Streptomyces sp. RB17]|nr:hypothetical protein [Streptomyces sp. RB17]